jgi:Xaa-Pro aminopeptidase
MLLKVRQGKSIWQHTLWQKEMKMTSNKNRLHKLRQKFNEKEIDGILISQPDNRFYLSGFKGSAGFLLITPSEQILATDFRYTEQATAQAPDYNIFQTAGYMREWLPRLTGDLNLKQLGIESEHVTFSLYQELSNIFTKEHPLSRLVPINSLVESLRAVKEPEEIEFITQAVQIADDAFKYIEETIDMGITERELAWEIEKYIRDQNNDSLPFEIIVASGPNSAMPHARPTSRVIKSGDALVIDMGATANAYTSDLTRTIYLGKRGNKAFKKIYDTVLKAQLNAIDGIKAGMTGAEADALARTVIAEAGQGDAFGHGLGHGIGLVTHEQPRLGPNSTDILVDGMVFSIEPGIYLSGWGGVRIEDTVVMSNGKIEVLSMARKM